MTAVVTFGTMYFHVSSTLQIEAADSIEKLEIFLRNYRESLSKVYIATGSLRLSTLNSLFTKTLTVRHLRNRRLGPA